MLVNEKIKNSYSASSNTMESQVVFSSRDNRSSRRDSLWTDGDSVSLSRP